MPKKSFTTNLLEFLEKLTKSMVEGDAMDVVFLDLAKVFTRCHTRGSRHS
jgi:hypothetical protein